MRCQPCREALSARIDGEDPGVPDELVERHLAGCRDCQAFADSAALVTRRLAIRPADPVPDLTQPILAAAFADRREASARAHRAASGSHWSRWALLVVALTQMAMALPPMLLGHDGGASVHVARELGSWDLALALALLLVVLRPARATGLVPFAAALVLAMAATAVIDVASGRAAVLGETQHLLDLAGLGLLWTIARGPVDTTPLLNGFRRSRPTLAA